MAKKKKKKKRDRMESTLAEHHRHKKTLQPPFVRLGNLTPSSWVNDRLPDMLWAVLIHDGIGRERALDVFRRVGRFVQEHPEAADVTLSGIAELAQEKRLQFVQNLVGSDPDVARSLRPILLFRDLPGLDEWRAAPLDAAIPKTDAPILASAVYEVLWHQSEVATDCRWVKLLCLILGDRVRYPDSMKDRVLEIFEYPNRGDLRKVRPSIRAAEMVELPSKKANPWPTSFWTFCYENTPCLPESGRKEEAPEREQEERERKEAQRDQERKHYSSECQRVGEALFKHFAQTSVTSAMDPRHEGACGFAFYSLVLFAELILHGLDRSISARLGIRALVECFITFAYLLQKADPTLWHEYRVYGAGQAKLAHLKLQEIGRVPECLNGEMLDLVANEDSWQELVTINIGHWGNSDLRTMSDQAGVKEVYDQYYGATSGYMHATWAAVRETVYEVCLNPLHRRHRVPVVNLRGLPNSTGSACELVNRVLELLHQAYPEFSERLAPFRP